MHLPYDLPSRSFSLNEESSYGVSDGVLLETICNLALVTVYDVIRRQ